MLEPHQRAALIPNDPGVYWHHFLGARFVEPPDGKNASLAIVVQAIEQQSPVHALVRGLMELSVGTSLPVVSDFHGELNLETREMSFHQLQPETHYSGQISANGRALILRETPHSNPIHLVHEETLAQLV